MNTEDMHSMLQQDGSAWRRSLEAGHGVPPEVDLQAGRRKGMSAALPWAVGVGVVTLLVTIGAFAEAGRHRTGAGHAPLTITATARDGATPKTAAATTAPADLSAVPVEFRRACGHPGVRVMLSQTPVTIRRSACDLAGVIVALTSDVELAVPTGFGKIANIEPVSPVGGPPPVGIFLSVADNGDVTVRTE